MKVKYLGTAAAEGWPAVFCECDACQKARELGGRNIRTRSQAMVDQNILIDFGPDTYAHVLLHNLDLLKIEHIFITHSHMDHFYPEDLIMRGHPYCVQKKNKSVLLYGNEKVKEYYEDTMDQKNDSPDLKERIKFQVLKPFQEVQAGDYKVTPLPAAHDETEDCFIYLFENKNGIRYLYGNDTGYFPSETWQFLQDKYLDYVSLDCTVGIMPDIKAHLGLRGNIVVKERMTELGIADKKTVFILNHFSHNSQLVYDQFIHQAEPYGFTVSYDGFELFMIKKTK